MPMIFEPTTRPEALDCGYFVFDWYVLYQFLTTWFLSMFGMALWYCCCPADAEGCDCQNCVGQTPAQWQIEFGAAPALTEKAPLECDDADCASFNGATYVADNIGNAAAAIQDLFCDEKLADAGTRCIWCKTPALPCDDVSGDLDVCAVCVEVRRALGTNTRTLNVVVAVTNDTLFPAQGQTCCWGNVNNVGTPSNAEAMSDRIEATPGNSINCHQAHVDTMEIPGGFIVNPNCEDWVGVPVTITPLGLGDTVPC